MTSLSCGRRGSTAGTQAEGSRGDAGTGRWPEPEEIREIYISEMRARNLKVPAEPVLDAVVDHITTGNPLPGIRVLGETLFQTGKEINDAMSRPRGRHAKGNAGGSNKSE